MPSPHIVMYTREGCHLCDEAWDILVAHQLHPIKVDIDSDPELQSRWTSCVPVIEVDGQVRFRGRVNPVLLRRLLEHRD